MATASCRRCKAWVEDSSGKLLECPSCGGPLDDECARCGKRERRDADLKRCIGCGEWICGRGQCSRWGYENLVEGVAGRVCVGCARRREMVPRPGTGKGAGSAAGVEAVERGRYYLYEATLELEARLRKLGDELTETMASKLGAALEEALARGLERGSDHAAVALRRALDDAGRRLRVRAAFTALAVVLVCGALAVALVLILR